jgi:hypothetical protein
MDKIIFVKTFYFLKFKLALLPLSELRIIHKQHTLSMQEADEFSSLCNVTLLRLF